MKNSEEETFKYVIFTIDDKKYALLGEKVKEIVIGFDIHYLPFVPSYIRGLINRHGDPYTVVDLKILFEKHSLNANKFIITRDDIGKLSFIISDITQIENVKSSSINIINRDEKNMDYFNKSITIGSDEIPILEIKKIEKKIADDIR